MIEDSESEPGCAVDGRDRSNQRGPCDVTRMAAGSRVLCDDQVGTGGGVPQHSSALFASSSTGAPFRCRSG